MAIIPPPATPAFMNSQIGLEYNTAILESPLTRQQQVIERSGARWRGSYTLPPMKRAQAAEWIAWLAAMKGQANTFHGYDPDARTPRGTNALTTASDNYTRNGDAINGTVGTIGSGGAWPTNWGYFINGTGNNAATTLQIQAINQTVNGIRCFRVRMSGTMPVSGNILFFTEVGSNGAPCVQGDIFTHSIYAGIHAGSVSGITQINSGITENTSGGGYVAESQGPSFRDALTADPSATRLTYTRTLTGASTARCRGSLVVRWNAGAVIDITLLIGASQNEKQPQATPYISTTGSVSLRNAGLRVFGAGQSGSSLVVRGFPALQSGLLLSGDYVELAGRLYMLTADVSSDYKGHATLQLAPALRSAPVNDALLTTVNTKCEMRLVDDFQSVWEANENSVFNISFSAEEVVL